MPVIKIIDKLDRHPAHTTGAMETSLVRYDGKEHIAVVSSLDPDLIVALCGLAGADDELNSIANANRIAACLNACAGMTNEQVSHGLVSASTHSATAHQRDTLQHTLAAIAQEIELAGFQVGGPAADPETDLNPRTARSLITRATERFAAIGALLAAHKE